MTENPIRERLRYSIDALSLVFAQLTLFASFAALFISLNYFDDYWPNDDRFLYLLTGYGAIAMFAISLLGRIHLKLRRNHKEQSQK